MYIQTMAEGIPMIYSFGFLSGRPKRLRKINEKIVTDLTEI